MLKDGLEKVVAGITSIDEILRVIDVDDDFGEDEADIKAALIGKPQLNTAEEILEINNAHNEIETL